MSWNKPGIFYNLLVVYWYHTHTSTPLEVKTHGEYGRRHKRTHLSSVLQPLVLPAGIYLLV